MSVAAAPALREDARDDTRGAIGALCLLCAFGMVWFHLQAPGWRAAYAALGLFVTLAVFVAARSLDRGDPRRFWRSRWRRIALPWLGWSGFYLCVALVLGREDPMAVLRPGSPAALLIGPALHLWILPFLLIASAVLVLVAPLTRGPMGMVRLVLCAVPLSIACFVAQSFVKPGVPFAQWAYAIPCACYGLIAARARAGGGWGGPAVFLGAVVAGSLALGATEDLGQMLAGALIFELVLRRPPRGRWAVGAGGLALGVYLVHPFVILIYYKLFAGDGRGIAAVLFVFALSLLATLAMRRLPGTRALV